MKVASVVRVRRSWGSAFQRCGAERLKERSPIVARLAEGVKRREAEQVLSVREGVYVWSSSVRYEGARLWRALNVRSRIL